MAIKKTFPGASALKKMLGTPRKIVVVTHWSPDGDAMGSSLGLMNYLKLCGHDVKVIVPNAYPDFLKWMKGDKQVIQADENMSKAKNAIGKAELIFCLDFNDLSRINEVGKLITATSIPKVLIDHHPNPSDFATYMLHRVESSSTAELVYDFIEIMGGAKLINKDIANCLYVGIMTDTGSFRFPSTSARTHHVVAALMNAGAENAINHQRIYDTNSEARMRLLGFALSEKMVVKQEMHTAYFTLNNKEHDRFEYKRGDTEGLVNYGLGMSGIIFSAFFAERDGVVKCSFRSKGKFDVNKFARAHFNGGGHRNAAGGVSKTSLKDTVAHFESLLALYSAELKKSV
jgi:phosphoesterase RecJ-like protein